MERSVYAMMSWRSLALLAVLGVSTAGAQTGPDGLPIVAPALEATSDDADFRIRVGERAVIERLPRANGSIVEMYARNLDPSVDLRALFRGNTSRIAAMDAVEHGGGVWLLRATLRKPIGGGSVDLDIRKEGDEFVFDVIPAKPPPARGRQPAPTLGELLAGEVPEATPEANPASVFRLLPGDAISQRMEAWEYEFSLTRSPPTVLAASWDRIDAARRAMLKARPGTSVHQEYMYYLGYYYLAKGFGREARYYFSQMSARPGEIPQRDIALERARAELACDNFDEARQWFAEAYALGGDHDSILEGLAVISLETGSPPRAPTARLMWASTSASGPLMLAAELLQMDGRVAESRDILEAIDPETLTPKAKARRALRLGDARFYDRYEGNVDQAALAWDHADPVMARSRDLFLELHQTGTDPQQWASLVPALVQASMQRSDAGAEALYLLSQIDAAIFAREDAINDLALILQRYPKKASGSDVPERFWRIYSSYVRSLSDAGRHFDVAALHESVWSPTVRRAVQAPEALVDVAEAYEAVGLPERAVEVLRQAALVLFDKGIDDPLLVYHLAELYAQVGEGAERLPDVAAEPFDPDFVPEPTDESESSPFGTAKDEAWKAGLDSIAYLRAMEQVDVPAGQIDLLEARLHAGREDYPAAAAALRRAALDPNYRDVASLRLALIDAGNGRCGRAVPVLRRLAVTERAADLMADSRPWLALARCEIAAGNVDRGGDAARTAAAWAESQLKELADSVEEAASAQNAREGSLPVPAEVAPPQDVSPADSEPLGGESLTPEVVASLGSRGLADIANARTATLREELQGILEAELQYAVGLAAVAEDWQDGALLDQLRERGGIWSAMAEDYRDDREFGESLDARGTIPWDGL